MYDRVSDQLLQTETTLPYLKGRSCRDTAEGFSWKVDQCLSVWWHWLTAHMIVACFQMLLRYKAVLYEVEHRETVNVSLKG